MKVLNEYQTHHYFDNYERAEMFCPNCASREVWMEQGSGDYYCGSDYICIACGCDFTIQGPSLNDEVRMQRKIKQLKEGVTFVANTPRGG